jgi:hypothetical protein
MTHTPQVLKTLAVAAALASLAAGAAQTERADLLLVNGKVLTVDPGFSVGQAVAVRDGLIVAIGTSEDLRRRFEAARTVDLAGRTAMPGFIDTHIHIRGNAARWIDLSEVRSLGELKDKVRAMAARLGAGQWVTGSGWSEDELVEKRRPLRGDLDEAAPGNPVILTRAGGHSSVANSAALRLAGITRDTPDPEGGMIERDERGEPNGIIRERAEIVGRLVPRASPEELRQSFIANLRRLLGLGITSIIQAGVNPDGYAEWEAVYAREGETLPRAAVQIYWSGPDRMRAFGKRTGDGDHRLRVGAVKMLVDGGFTGPAAYTLAPYKGQPNYRGSLNQTPEQLYAAVKAGHDLGWQFGLHTIGDGAIVLAVDTFERVLRESPRADHRHYLNHFTVPPPDRTMVAMAKLGVLVAQQPNFTYTLEGRYVDNLDGDRLARNNPLASVMHHGVFLALGSDILPIGPMVGLYAAVTRRGMSGAVYGEGERLTMVEAIRGYTSRAAFLTREEAVKGTLEPGRLADIIVLSADPITIDPGRLRDVKVDLTIVGGRIVYERRER